LREGVCNGEGEKKFSSPLREKRGRRESQPILCLAKRESPTLYVSASKEKKGGASDLKEKRFKKDRQKGKENRQPLITLFPEKCRSN